MHSRLEAGTPSGLAGPSVEESLRVQFLDSLYPAGTLGKVLVRKVAGRLFGRRDSIEPVTRYNGLVLFHRPSLHGGGLEFGQDFCRTLHRLGVKPCANLFEFCAGPGYIGYNLLANGFCEYLTLADVNPAAVEVARVTAERNNIEHRVKIYHSDGLSQIDSREKWDLVVSNPPHFLPGAPNDTENIRTFDPDWSVHRAFYSSIKKFMKPGGLVVMQENCAGSTVEDFASMIAAGGGKLVTTLVGTDLRGKEYGYYYIMSEW